MRTLEHYKTRKPSNYFAQLGINHYDLECSIVLAIDGRTSEYSKAMEKVTKLLNNWKGEGAIICPECCKFQ